MLSLPGGAQVQNPGFTRLSVEQGLPRATVYSICQDSREFIWIGTTGGLCRYDGYTFKVHDELYFNGESIILQDSRGWLWYDPAGELHRLDPATNKVTRYRIGLGTRTYRILKDRSGDIWAATLGDGLGRYVPSADTFEVFTHRTGNPLSLASDTVFVIYEDSRGVLWVASRGGLQKFDRENNAFTSAERVGRISTLCEGVNNELWLGTGSGLWRYDPSTGTCEPFRNAELDGSSILSIYLTRNHEFWVATADRIVRFDGEKKQFGIIKATDPKAQLRPDGFPLNHFYEDRQGRLWVSTSAGLVLYNRRTDRLEPFRARPDGPYLVGEGDVTAMMEDNVGRLWVGTQNGGLLMLDRFALPFVHVAQNPSDRIRLSHTSVSALMEDHAGILWVGSFHGLDRIDPSTGAVTHYNEAFSDSDTDPEDRSRIHALVEDGPNLLWIATSNGLWLMERNSGKFTRFPHHAGEAGFSAGQAVTSLCRGNGSTLWVGGGDKSGLLMRFDRRTRKFTNYYSFDPPGYRGSQAYPIPVLYLDRSGTIWISKGDPSNTVRMLTTGFGAVRSFEFLSMCEDADGTLWAATTKGLARFNQANGALEFPLNKNGPGGGGCVAVLPGTTGSKEVERKGGNLWLATEGGLVRFNPSTDEISRYGTAEGVPIAPSENLHAFFKQHQGYLYFGGTNGFVRFHPDSLRDNTHVPPVVISSFKTFGVEHELDSAITSKKVIDLSYGENVIAFEFAALNYSRPERNQYAYKLEGFDDDWVHAGIRRSVSYTNLDPGTYIFRVKGSNSDGLWNEAGTSLVLIVHPPFWRTWWAYLGYLLVMIALLYGAFRFQHNRIVLRHEVAAKELEARHFKEVSEIKSRFFANISHEFRTPLTLIMGPVRRWKEHAHADDERKDLSMVERNAQRLLQLINQLLDLSKLEAGGMTLHARCMNVVPFLKGLTYSFESSAGVRGLSLEFCAEQEEVQIYCDRDVLEKIVSNLLSNALKFTPGGGRVEVGVKQEREFLQVTVSDSGIGIAPEHLMHVFDRFYQVDGSTTREHGGTGIGLALVKELVELHHGTIAVTSTPGAGTTFTVSLPLGKEQFSPEEIVEATEEAEAGGKEQAVPALRPDTPERSGSAAGVPMDEKEHGPVILVVEDNADVRTYIRGQLSEAYQVLEASDGAEGIAKAIEAVPDLVVSDVMMPKKDGYALCHTLKTDERTSHIPVILLTARAATENKLEGLETGADDYLIKPFEPKELQVRVKNLIEQRRKLRERFRTSVPLKPGEVAVSSMDDAFLKKVIAAVEEHMGEETFGTEELAAIVGMSRVQLHRKVTALSNQSPGEFIRYLRLHRAMELLEKDAGTVSEIAFLVGFGNVSSFSRSFHAQFGRTPSDVRKAQKAPEM